jgi:hypothetical protein
MTHDRVNPFAPRRAVPRLLHALAFATLATACLLTGGMTWQLLHLRGAAAATATGPARSGAMLLVASVLLAITSSVVRDQDRRRIDHARQQAATDYARMLHRTAAIEREIYGEVLSYSVQEFLAAAAATQADTGHDRVTDKPGNTNQTNMAAEGATWSTG